jgi:hypothetical protein
MRIGHDEWNIKQLREAPKIVRVVTGFRGG